MMLFKIMFNMVGLICVITNQDYLYKYRDNFKSGFIVEIKKLLETKILSDTLSLKNCRLNVYEKEFHEDIRMAESNYTKKKSSILKDHTYSKSSDFFADYKKHIITTHKYDTNCYNVTSKIPLCRTYDGSRLNFMFYMDIVNYFSNIRELFNMMLKIDHFLYFAIIYESKNIRALERSISHSELKQTFEKHDIYELFVFNEMLKLYLFEVHLDDCEKIYRFYKKQKDRPNYNQSQIKKEEINLLSNKILELKKFMIDYHLHETSQLLSYLKIFAKDLLYKPVLIFLGHIFENLSWFSNEESCQHSSEILILTLKTLEASLDVETKNDLSVFKYLPKEILLKLNKFLKDIRKRIGECLASKIIEKIFFRLHLLETS